MEPNRWTAPLRRARIELASALLPLALAASGCQLAEVVTPAGSDVLVVESVLRAGETRQKVLLHRTLTGDAVRGEPGARVVLRRSGGPDVVLEEQPTFDCTGPVTRENPDPVAVEATCYATGAGGLEVRPGERYELRIETRAGEVVRGQTDVPGDFGLRIPGLSRDDAACVLPPGTRLELTWSSARGAWSYLAGIRIQGLRQALGGAGFPVPDVLELTGVAISESDTTLVVPSELGVFERFGSNQELLRALQEGFPPGVTAEMIVSAVDRNYVNAVRGGSFNPSGSVRVSSVVGDGIGVFGSVVPRRLFVLVGSREGDLPSCLGRGTG